MTKIIDFLNEAKVYYIATVENEQPRVRPFGAATEYNGRLYLSTSNDKNVFKQFIENPKIEMSGMAKGKWIRIAGIAVVDENLYAKQAMLDANPFLKGKYSIDDEKFTVFYVDNMTAILYSNTEEPIELR